MIENPSPYHCIHPGISSCARLRARISKNLINTMCIIFFYITNLVVCEKSEISVEAQFTVSER